MARLLLLRVERRFGAAFGAANPWHHLGALAFFLFWVIAATGIYLYAFFDTSVAGAHRSVELLTHDQWYLGSVMRSLHRYAADAFVVVLLAHLGRELARGHYRGFRWFSWMSGVALIWLVYASGIGGYWLVWDQLAQFSIIATAEWLDWLAIGGGAVVRNFVESVDDRFFSLLIFLHIGIPLVLLAGMWVHIQRISRADTLPPRALAAGTLAALLVAALAWPAQSHAPADLTQVPHALAVDWLYLFAHPLQYATSPSALWMLATLATAALAALPVLVRRTRLPAAVVSPSNCNGCGRCFADCPYAAIAIEPRAAGRAGQKIAVVATDLCASCGVCAGACPSSTPFRSTDALLTGIDVPDRPIAALRNALECALRAAPAGERVVVFGCDDAADLSALRDALTIPISLRCTGMLPPSFVEYALRAGAAGVLVTGCPPGECAYRLGARLTEARLAGRRAPRLRASVRGERVRLAWAGRGEDGKLHAALAQFRAALAHTKQQRLQIAARARKAGVRA